MQSTIRYRKNIFSRIMDTLSNMEEFEITISQGVLSRTELLCLYIEEDTRASFTLDSFIKLLYSDFLNYAVKNPTPKRILKEASRKVKTEDNDSYIRVVFDGVETYEKSVYTSDTYFDNKTVSIKIDKGDAKKIKIILDEIRASERVYITTEELLASLWTNFIDDYRTGTNKRAYKSIINVLKSIDFSI